MKTKIGVVLALVVVSLLLTAASPAKPLAASSSKAYIWASCANGAYGSFRVDFGRYTSYFRKYDGGTADYYQGFCWSPFWCSITRTAPPGSYEYHYVYGEFPTHHSAGCLP